MDQTVVSPNPGDPGPSLVGRLLDGRYRLDSVIARGGMATVYMAIDTRLDRIVAVKVMHKGLADDPTFVERFTREAKAAAKVAGPEVVAVFDTGTDPDTGIAYLVMEYVRGQNLRQQLLTTGPLSPSRAVTTMEPVLKALANAHDAGLVHRDIKPENVLIGDDGRVKVADFGLARAVASTAVTQTTTSVMGSIAYLAPEQIDKGSADERSDVYAAGVLLWELLTGTVPHQGETLASVLHMRVNDAVPAPSTLVEGIPAALDDLVVRATQIEPADRPENAGVFLRELQAVKAALPAPAPLAGPAPTRALVVPRVVDKTPTAAVAKPRKSRRGLVGIAILIVLALLALGGGYYLGSYRYTHTPNVFGLKPAAAQQALKKAGLGFKEVDEFSEQTAGTELRQSPKAGARVKKSGTVTVYYSKGRDLRLVASFAGKDPDAATAALTDAGLKFSLPPAIYSSVPNGKVVRTDPPAGARLAPGTTVKVYVSKGPEPVGVPDLAGKQQDEATRTLRDKLGFKVAVVLQFSDDKAAGIVISNSPNSGTAAKGSTVTLTVSKGPDVVEVPDVRDQSPESATAALEAKGFVVKRQDAFFGTGTRVYNTDPKPHKKIKRGSTVTILVV